MTSIDFCGSTQSDTPFHVHAATHFEALAARARLDDLCGRRLAAQPARPNDITETVDRIRTAWLAQRWRGEEDSIRLQQEILACRDAGDLLRRYSGWARGKSVRLAGCPAGPGNQPN